MGRSRRLVVDNTNAWLFRSDYLADPKAGPDGLVTHADGDYIVFDSIDGGDQKYTVTPGLFGGLNTAAFTSFVVWGKGVVSFGAPTAAQKAFMAAATAATDLSKFPGAFITIGYVDPASTDLYVGFRNPATAAPFDANTIIRFGSQSIEIYADHVAVSDDGEAVIDLGTGVRLTAEDSVLGEYHLASLLLVNGKAGNDVLNGTAAAQTIHGLEGKDTITAGTGASDLFGDAGDDTLTGGSGKDRLYGGDGNDTIRGGFGDTIDAGRGNDTIYAERGMSVSGGEGIDRLVLDYSGESSAQVTLSLPGTQSAYLAGSDTLYTGIERFDIIGGNLHDTLTGNAGANRIEGGNGGDILDGGGGNDTLDAGIDGPSIEPAVTAKGETFNSSVALDNAFSARQDAIPQAHIQIAVPEYGEVGQAGTTTIDYYYSFDVLEGGYIIAPSSTATIALLDANGSFVQSPAPGDQIYVTDLAAGRYTLQYSFELFPPPFDSGESFITVDFFVELSTAVVPVHVNTLSGGTGDDTFLVHQASDAVIEKLGAGTDIVIADLSWTLSDHVENLKLKAGAGAINGSGNALANTLTGNEFDNTLSGGNGNDTLYGGAGNDDLRGDAGADSMSGGAGNDTYGVGSSGDLVIEKPGGGTDTALSRITYTLTTDVENLTLLGTGNINGTGNGLANLLIGNAGNNVLDGGKGIDRMLGGAGDDTYRVDDAKDQVYETVKITGGADAGGTDTVISTVSYNFSTAGRKFVENLVLGGTAAIDGSGNALGNRIDGNDSTNVLSGNDGSDQLFGRGGKDTLKGGAGDDALVGGTGNDWLTPGSGKDVMTGGADADQFVFTAPAVADATSAGAADRITDFSHAEGDRIDLKAIDASTLLAGDQAFSFLGTAAFTGEGGELRLTPSGNATLLVGDLDGDKVGDLFIRLSAGLTLAAADFVL